MYIVVKFQVPNPNTSCDMNYFPPFIFHHSWSSPDYGQTESDAYEPTVQLAQVGSIK